MRTINGLIVGWIDSNIAKLLQLHSAMFSKFAYVMVTSVDSCQDLAGIAMGYQILEKYNGCSLFAGSLLLPGRHIAEVSRAYNLFNGFDEIWVFDERPKYPKPVDLWILAPLDLGSDDIPALLVSWMNESGCRLGLGDGIGVNYVAIDPATARRLADAATSEGEQRRE